MDFRFPGLTRWLLVAGVALAEACSVEAQNLGQKTGEAILFSPVNDDDINSNMPSLAAKPPKLLDLANTVQLPTLKFDAAPETVPLPQFPRPTILPAQAQQMQRLLDERKNWALMTPEQILGLRTPEQMLGIPDRDELGQPKNETVVVQFYERQKQLRARTNDDNYGTPGSVARWSFSGSSEAQMNPNIWVPAGSTQGNSVLVDQFLNGTPDNRASPSPAPLGGWPKTFTLPAPPPEPTPSQQAAMEQFQQLLQPRSLSGGTAKASELGRPIFVSPSTAPDLVPGQFSMMPAGASFKPLNGGIAMPVGATSLSGLLGHTNAASPAFAPEWKPQLPPWMVTTPQLGVIPQRKF